MSLGVVFFQRNFSLQKNKTDKKNMSLAPILSLYVVLMDKIVQQLTCYVHIYIYIFIYALDSKYITSILHMPWYIQRFFNMPAGCRISINSMTNLWRFEETDRLLAPYCCWLSNLTWHQFSPRNSGVKIPNHLQGFIPSHMGKDCHHQQISSFWSSCTKSFSFGDSL